MAPSWLRVPSPRSTRSYAGDCPAIAPIVDGNWTTVGSRAVVERTRFACHRYLLCGADGQWSLQGGETALPSAPTLTQLRVSCLPDVSAGACSPSAAACASCLSGRSCVAAGCSWCESAFRSSSSPSLLQAPACQPAVPYYSATRSEFQPSCASKWTAPPVPAVLSVDAVFTAPPPSCNVTELSLIARCCSKRAWCPTASTRSTRRHRPGLRACRRIDASWRTRACVYSPAHELCIRSPPASINIPLLGHARCPYVAEQLHCCGGRGACARPRATFLSSMRARTCVRGRTAPCRSRPCRRVNATSSC
jgi:hypothetical protein